MYLHCSYLCKFYKRVTYLFERLNLSRIKMKNGWPAVSSRPNSESYFQHIAPDFCCGVALCELHCALAADAFHAYIRPFETRKPNLICRTKHIDAYTPTSETNVLRFHRQPPPTTQLATIGRCLAHITTRLNLGLP
jgi:hypothetical protein